ncbi:MAG TPA: type IV pilus assembly protein PilM [Candidatus Paceibacterota bacterium]|nr:type IV pilus assembly protein PilM [Candidatus Paceibacterota bacterium]
MNFLDRMKSLFSLGSSSNVAVGIDIGTSSIKVVQVKREGGRAVLDTYGALTLGPYVEGGFLGAVTNLPPELLAKALKDVLKETNITTTNVVLGIPSLSCIIFIIQLPAVIDEASLATVVPNEAKKFIPVPLSDVSLDWYTIPRREDSSSSATGALTAAGGEQKISVLVVATLNETLVRYTQTLQKSGLPFDSLEIDVFSQIRSVIARELSPVLLMDIGASKTKLAVIEHGIVETFHLVNRGGQDMSLSVARSLELPFDRAELLKKETGILPSTDHPQIQEILTTHFTDIFSETNSILLAYEKRYNKSVSKIILSGGGALTRGLLEYAKGQFSAEVVLADPFAKMEAPVFLQGVLKTTGPEFSIAIGLALKKLQQ